MATIQAIVLLLGLALASSSAGEDGWKQVMKELKKTNYKLEQANMKLDKMKNDMKTQAEEIEELHIDMKSLRGGLANQLDHYDKKIEWAITDGSLAPRNTSWVEENFHAVANKLSYLEKKLVKFAHCGDVYVSGKRDSGVYAIYPYGDDISVSVYCDHSHGGGWTVIQKRYDGSEDFDRTWNEYITGFGDKNKEHWLGLNLIHSLTTLYKMNLYIEIRHFVTNQTYYAQYNNFIVANRRESFKLLVGGYSGNAGNSMAYHNGAYFYTKDRDNEHLCAFDRGGWWHKECTYAALNAVHSAVELPGERRPKNMFWWDHAHPDLDEYIPLKATLMKIRPAHFGQ